MDLYEDYQMRSALKLAYLHAQKSTDRSTQIGAIVLVPEGAAVAWGTNTFPEGWIPTEADYERPRKYLVTEHAERNAIYMAAKVGVETEGCTLVSTWAACADCARAIVQAGFKTLVRHVPPSDDAVNRWLESVSLGDEIMRAGGVNIVNITGRIIGAPSILRDGQAFYPDLIGVGV